MKDSARLANPHPQGDRRVAWAEGFFMRPRSPYRGQVYNNAYDEGRKARLSMPVTRDRTTVVYAPQGWGKTRQVESLRRSHKCIDIVDEWLPGEPLRPGALHLTNCRLTGTQGAPFHYVELQS